MAEMIGLRDIVLRREGFELRLDLAIPRGRRLGLIGPSGAGKSTTLDLIAGFAVPDSGRVEIGGANMTGAGVTERPVSILFQDGNLFPHLDVFRNVALGLRNDLRLSEAERARVTDALRKVGIAEHAHAMPGRLSGGQQARVALARILLRDRPVLLVDEPFASLDPRLREGMAALLTELCEETGATLVMVTHDLRGTEGLLTDIALMEEGRVVLEGEATTLRRDRPEALRPWL